MIKVQGFSLDLAITICISLIHWRNIHGGFTALIGLYSQVTAARRKPKPQPKALLARHGNPLFLYVSVSPVFRSAEDLCGLTSQSLHKEFMGNTGATQFEEYFPLKGNFTHFT